MKKQFIRSFAWLILGAMLLSLTGMGAAATEPEPDTPAQEASSYTIDTESEIYKLCQELTVDFAADQLLVYDATDDKILYTWSDEGEKLYPASTTKLYSAYVALQYLDPYDVITAGEELSLVPPDSSRAYIGRGHMLYTKTVILGMMLPSGNDAALVLATAAGRKIAENEELGAEEAIAVFVDEMNRMAEELGFERSHFSNPDGYHVGSHYTCLNDMARIAKLALENPTIAQCMRTSEQDVMFASGQTITWTNSNLFLNKEQGFYRGDTIGMKTGYTSQAEYCLMSAFRCAGGRTLVIGYFGCEDTYQRYREVAKLANACKEQMEKEARGAG